MKINPLYYQYNIHTMPKSTAVSSFGAFDYDNNDYPFNMGISRWDFYNLLCNYQKPNFVDGRKYNINLHMHSKYSDGYLGPHSMLEIINRMAQKLPKDQKFVFSLTDHDTIDGCKVIKNLIKNDPLKYEKVLFIPGVELSAIIDDDKLLDSQIDLDVLLYGFDPDDKQINKFIKSRNRFANKNSIDLLRSYITRQGLPSDDYSHILKAFNADNFDAKEGMLFLRKLYKRSHYDECFVNNLFKSIYGSAYCPYGALSNLPDIADFATKNDYSLVMAHPGRVPFEMSLPEGVCYEKFIKYLLNYLYSKNIGIEALYASYEDAVDAFRGSVIDKQLNTYDNFLLTGGQDNHGTHLGSFFKREDSTSNYSLSRFQ